MSGGFDQTRSARYGTLCRIKAALLHSLIQHHTLLFYSYFEALQYHSSGVFEGLICTYIGAFHSIRGERLYEGERNDAEEKENVMGD